MLLGMSHQNCFVSFLDIQKRRVFNPSLSYLLGLQGCAYTSLLKIFFTFSISHHLTIVKVIYYDLVDLQVFGFHYLELDLKCRIFFIEFYITYVIIFWYFESLFMYVYLLLKVLVFDPFLNNIDFRFRTWYSFFNY